MCQDLWNDVEIHFATFGRFRVWFVTFFRRSCQLDALIFVTFFALLLLHCALTVFVVFFITINFEIQRIFFLARTNFNIFGINANERWCATGPFELWEKLFDDFAWSPWRRHGKSLSHSFREIFLINGSLMIAINIFRFYFSPSASSFRIEIRKSNRKKVAKVSE